MTNREDEILANISHCQFNNDNNGSSTTNVSGEGGGGGGTGVSVVQNAEIDNQNIDFGSDSLLVSSLVDSGTASGSTVTSTSNNTSNDSSNQKDMSSHETNQNNEESHHHLPQEVSAVNDWTENSPSSASSGFSDDDSLAGMEGTGDYKTIEQIVEMVKAMGKQGLIKEYAEIRARPPDGTFTQARHRNNLAKNRYTDVLCYDHSRVVLSQVDDDINSDYINANFVDGYKQKNAYISTQGESLCVPVSQE